MPRPKKDGMMTIVQVESMLNALRGRAEELTTKRKTLAADLDSIDRELNLLRGGFSGSAAPTPSKSPDSSKGNGRAKASGNGGKSRAKNSMSLVAMLEKVLSESGQPMSVSDILTAVEKGGYKSSSNNFRGLLNQTLIKDDRFGSASRGMYEMKKD